MKQTIKILLLLVCYVLIFSQHANAETICPRSQKYHSDGHGNTTAIVARFAGHNDISAKRLAYFSQAPDELWARYSAPSVAIWGWLPGTWGYRKRVFDTLHSLHGGDADAVIKRQKKLSIILTDQMTRNAKSWRTGLIIHALADSYAHTKGEGVNVRAYGPPAGHAFAWKEKPDEINRRPKLYKKYVKKLFRALSNSNSDPTKLTSFFNGLDQALKTAVSSSDRDEQSRIVTQFIVNFDQPRLTSQECAVWAKELRLWTVFRFLKSVNSRL